MRILGAVTDPDGRSEPFSLSQCQGSTTVIVGGVGAIQAEEPAGVKRGQSRVDARQRGNAEVATSRLVSSVALQTWKRDAKKALDEIAAAHKAVGGSGPGRRYATQEVNRAYAVLLTSQFQRFCRDLHTEAVAHLVAATDPPSVRPILRARLTESRKLDKGNPTPGNRGSDFGYLGFSFWDALTAQRLNRYRGDSLTVRHSWRRSVQRRPLREFPPWAPACGCASVLLT